MSQARRGNQWYFGMRAHIGVEGASGSRTRRCSSSAGYTPLSRHQALRLASSRLAVWITDSSRAGPAFNRSCKSLFSSTRRRESASVRTPTYRDTRSSVALSGGSNRGTASALRAFDHLAIRQPRAPLQGKPREGNSVDAAGVSTGLRVSGFFTDGKIAPIFYYDMKRYLPSRPSLAQL